jgi:hypothetical protein
MNIDVAQERIEAAVNNIMSGDNECGTLANAAYKGDRDYFRKMLMPVLAVYEHEAAELRRQRDYAGKDAEAKRFALEFIAQNLGGTVQITEPAIIEAVMRALPGRAI